MPSLATQLARGVCGIVALAAGYYAIVIGLDVLDVLTRPINQGWIEVLVMLLLPLFIGIAALVIVSILLGRFAWLGRMW